MDEDLYDEFGNYIGPDLDENSDDSDDGEDNGEESSDNDSAKSDGEENVDQVSLVPVLSCPVSSRLVSSCPVSSRLVSSCLALCLISFCLPVG
jgi:hypothetical protein